MSGGVNEGIAGVLAGVCSGITKVIIGHPFDTLKVRLQSSKKFTSTLDCLRQTIQKESFFGLYKGSTPPLVGFILMDAIQMGTLANARRFLQARHPEKKLATIEHALGGLLSGISVAIAATPMEQLKARLQIQYGQSANGPIQLAKRIVKGILGLWTGFAPCLLFRSFFWVLWGSYDIYKSMLESANIKKKYIPFIAGGLAANTFWIVSFPADVVKCRMMVQNFEPHPHHISHHSNHMHRKEVYVSMRDCYKKIWQKEGIKGFYRGFAPCILRSFPTNGAAILVYEYVFNSLKLDEI